MKKDAEKATKEGTRPTMVWSILPYEGPGCRYDMDFLFPALFDRDQLYNLNTDIFMQKNLINIPENKAKLDELRIKMTELSKQIPHSFGEFRE